MVGSENRSGAYFWVREPAHDPEIEIDFGKVVRKIKVLQRPLRAQQGARRCREAQVSAVRRPASPEYQHIPS
jgi:hypothetical protein